MRAEKMENITWTQEEKEEEVKTEKMEKTADEEEDVKAEKREKTSW